MEALALAIAVVTAIGGWVVNGILARRATRRDLRVTFLLSAYRSLDAASNRPLKTAALREQLENAIADITLIGKEDQVRLATDFARTFAATGGADTSELLEALRSDLRKNSCWVRSFQEPHGCASRPDRSGPKRQHKSEQAYRLSPSKPQRSRLTLRRPQTTHLAPSRTPLATSSRS